MNGRNVGLDGICERDRRRQARRRNVRGEALSSTKRESGKRADKMSQALVERPFGGRWSEEGAARVRELPGVVIGPYHANVDVNDPASVRAALEKEPFGHLIPDEAIEKLCREGNAGGLFSDGAPTWRYGIDPLTFPCYLLPPTIEELEAIEDKVHLASLIRDLDVRGTTPRTRALIRSTVDPEWSWLGETVQDRLESDQEEE
jgi:hypothetical protein